jgi:hypothetical protein
VFCVSHGRILGKSFADCAEILDRGGRIALGGRDGRGGRNARGGIRLPFRLHHKMKQRWRALGCLTCAVAASLLPGCSKKHDAGGSPARSAAGSACKRQVLTLEDVAGILRAPITHTRALPGDAESCEFSTGGFPALVISVRPGVGRTTVDTWKSGKMPLTSSPVSGIGDAAVWQGTLHELVAQKNELLCEIQVRGAGADLAIDASALPAAAGALCNKVFAAY